MEHMSVLGKQQKTGIEQKKSAEHTVTHRTKHKHLQHDVAREYKNLGTESMYVKHQNLCSTYQFRDSD